MKKHTHWRWTLLALSLGMGAQAAEIDAGAILNKYRHEMEPGYYKPELPAAEAAQYDVFQGLDVQGLPEQARPLLMEFNGARAGQRVLLKAVVMELERLLQDRGFPYVLQAVEMPGQQFMPTFKAEKVRFGKVLIDRPSPLNVELATRVLSYGVTEGEPVNRIQLERNSTVLNELAGVTTAYQMTPGEAYGVTDLRARLSEAAAHAGSATLDNTGTQALGRANARGDVALQNRFGQGDVLRLYGLKSQHSQMAGADASYLATASGWRLGSSLSRFTYDYDAVVSSQSGSRNLGASGNLGLYAVYPWLRNEFGRHTVSLNADRSSTQSDVALRTAGVWTPRRNLSDVRLQKLSASLYGIQALPEAYTGSYQLAVSAGNARQDNLSAAAQDEGTAQQMGHFTKLTLSGSLSKQQVWQDRSWVVSMAANAQLATRNLPGAEKAYFGGMGQMRAWNPQALPADEALYAELKMETAWTPNLRLGAFAEWVSYRLNHENHLAAVDNVSVPTAPTNAGALADWGLTGVWSVDPRWQLRAVLARKISGNPMVNTKLLVDPDRTRGWVSLNYTF